MKKLLSLALCLALLCGLAACGAADPSDVAASLAKAQETAAGLKSAKVDMSRDMSYTIVTGDDRMDVTTNMDMSTETVAEPLTAYATMNLDIMGIDMDIYYYIRQEGDGYAAYVSADGAEWTRQDLPEDQIAQYNAVESVEFYLSVADSFAYTGEEERDGVKLYRYDGELSGDQLGRAVELSGMDEMLSSYGAGADTVFQGSMPMSIWLDAETFAPVRYEFDMSQIVGGFMQGVFESEGAGLENSSVSVSLDLSEFDAIDSIEAPAGIE